MTEDKIIQKIEKYFEVPERVKDKAQNVVEKAKGGYVLIETRPPWDDSQGLWTKSPIAKFIFNKPLNMWRLYWMRVSGKWELYKEYKKLDKILKIIKEDIHGCFWG